MNLDFINKFQDFLRNNWILKYLNVENTLLDTNWSFRFSIWYESFGTKSGVISLLQLSVKLTDEVSTKSWRHKQIFKRQIVLVGHIFLHLPLGSSSSTSKVTSRIFYQTKALQFLSNFASLLFIYTMIHILILVYKLLYFIIKIIININE